MRSRLFILMLASIFLVPSSGSAAAPLNYRDKMGRTVTIQIPVRRAVLLQTSDLLPVTGAWDQVVGLSRYAVEDDDLLKAAKPDLARLVASVGNAGQINVEALLQLKPDVVVTWSVNPDMVRFLEQKGVPVVAVFPETIGELYEVMRLQGRLFGREKQVESGISRMEEMFSFIRRRVAAIPLTQRKKALWLSGKPTTVSGGNTINHELMALAGLDNLGQAVMRHTYEVSQEQIVAWNPDQLFIWGHARYSAADVLNNPQWRHIKAVKEHNVFKSPKWDSWSPRLAPMALWMAATAYPEQFKDIDLTKTIDKFYRDVYGIPYSKVTQIER